MTISYSYSSTTAITTPPITTTKVVVVASAACWANINGAATATSNAFPLIPAGIKTSINMQGINNTLSLLPAAGATTYITVTQVGNVAASGIAGPLTGNVYTNG